MDTRKVKAECVFSIGDHTPSEKDVHDELACLIGRKIVEAGLYKEIKSDSSPYPMTKTVRMIV